MCVCHFGVGCQNVFVFVFFFFSFLFFLFRVVVFAFCLERVTQGFSAEVQGVASAEDVSIATAIPYSGGLPGTDGVVVVVSVLGAVPRP